MANIQVDVRGETCPVPLVEMRKALRQADAGDMVEIVGTHRASREEIPMALEALEARLVSIEDFEDDWRIVVQA